MWPLIMVGLFYLAIGLGTVGVMVLFYFIAVMSRRVYRCPHCHEVVHVERMEASFCNVCGAPLHSEE